MLTDLGNKYLVKSNDHYIVLQVIKKQYTIKFDIIVDDGLISYLKT